jgi:hypothetical protein
LEKLTSVLRFKIENRWLEVQSVVVEEMANRLTLRKSGNNYKFAVF